MKKALSRGALTLASILTLASCGVPINAEVKMKEEETLQSTVPSFVGNIATIIGKHGNTLFERQLINWELGLLGSVFKACGLDFLASGGDGYSAYFEQINDELKEIEQSLKNIQSTLEEQEAARIMDNFQKEFLTLKNAMDPVIAGLANCADRENAASKIADKEEREAKQATLLKEAEGYYDSYIANLRLTNSFAERVIALAQSITNPSSNAKYSLLRCFTVTTLDASGLYPWDSMRINAKKEFLVYVSTTLLDAASLARYEITYKYTRPDITGGDKAFWETTNRNLGEAVSSALDLLQKEINAVEANENEITGGVITHVATGISLNSTLAETSMDKSVSHNILSYQATKKQTSRRYYYHYWYKSDNLELYDTMRKEYATYIEALGFSSGEFTFMDYLSTIGFSAKNDLSTYQGLVSQVTYWHVGSTLTDEWDYVDVNHITRDGESSTDHDLGVVEGVKNPVMKKRKYYKFYNYSQKWLLFLKPHSNYVYGSYPKVTAGYTDWGKSSPYASLSYEFTYSEASQNKKIGYYDPSW